MKLERTAIDDLFILHRPVSSDMRGAFTRLFGADEIAAAGRPTKAVHINSSTSIAAGTLRGIHFQYPPHAEAKIVACTAGSVWDVGVDLRPGSPTRFQWFGTTLTPSNGISLIIPEGFGHAFVTLEPNSTVVYVVSSAYALSHESGFRYDDPSIAINWPVEPSVISRKDLEWEPVKDRLHEIDERFA